MFGSYIELAVDMFLFGVGITAFFFFIRKPLLKGFLSAFRNKDE